MSKIILACILETISTRHDGTIKFSIGTNEVDPTQAASLFQLRGKYIKVLLSDSNISTIEEKLIDEEKIHGSKKAKSPSERLRNILFRLHEARQIQIPFDDWYKNEMESIISGYQNLLNEYN